MSDRASKALAEASLPGEPRIYDTRSKCNRVPLAIFYCFNIDDARKERGLKASNKYLTLSEEKALKKYLKLSLQIITGLKSSKSVIQNSNHNE
jgi:hypothetical protein